MNFIDRLNCPVCSSTGRELYRLSLSKPPLSEYFRDFYPPQTIELFRGLEEDFVLARCESERCGCWYQQRVPPELFLRRFYSCLAPAKGTPESVDPYLQEQRFRELMMVARFLQPRVPIPAVLDFGTGDGSWPKLAWAAGCNASACDLVDAQADDLRRLGVAFYLPEELRPEAFDFINTEQVFEHLTNPAALLTNLVRSLRPGGVLKIGVPFDPDLERKLSHPDWRAAKSTPDSLNSVAPIEHLNAYTPWGLRELGIQAGLGPLHVDGWTLRIGRHPPNRGRLHSGIKRYLLSRLHADYRPPYRLAQTGFFHKPLSGVKTAQIR